MNLKELSSPIRMYWDIGPAGNGPSPDYRRIAGEIAANKVLSLQVTDPSPTLSHACLAILDALKNSMAAISLVAQRSALDASAIALIQKTPVRLLLVSTGSLSGLGPVAELAERTNGKPAVGVSFSVSRKNFNDLPDVLAFCVERRIANLVLPMQRLAGDEECFFLPPAERQELTARLKGIDMPAWLKIVIHDPFLWKAFYPSVEFPDGGCQAANTMLYISSEAGVYPCPSLPVKIGSLLTSSLGDVIRSDRKRDIRKSILQNPAACEQCGEVDQCKGGCRGRTYALKKTLNEPDPACR